MSSLVAVFGATRADLSPLGPVLSALAASTDLYPVLIASGTTGNAAFGDPVADLGIPGLEVVPVAADASAADPRALAAAGARLAADLPGVLRDLAPAAYVVLGDRWELLYAIPPAVLLGVPVVHLHGGEVTEGAIDDRVRHAVAKLADLHCVSTQEAADRLCQMGEPVDRVVVTGAPSLDRFADVLPATEHDLAALLGATPARPLALLTYHPATAGRTDPAEGSRAVLEAAAAVAGSVLVTYPGLDTGREVVVAQVEAAVAEHPHVVAVESLGRDYLPTLAAADVVVGNSSSGILEAASFGVPVVNVGDRQRGRASAANVIDAGETRADVEAALTRALSTGFRARAAAAENPYGDGHSAVRIVDVVRRAVREGVRTKPFVDRPLAGERA